MAEIVLTTLNARFAHTGFGLRYLYANLGALSDRARILEFDTQQRPLDVAEAILAEKPKIVGLGVYIWNVEAASKLVGLLKVLDPSVMVILGGPEVSYETDEQDIACLADCIVTGEADLEFRNVCNQILTGDRPPAKIIHAPFPAVEDLALPYRLYTDADIAHRTLYVEASRGCPFSCEFCLSSLDIPVRQFPLEAFLGELQILLDRGATRFKFVDRTFNLVEKTGIRILSFLLERYKPGCFFHFEMVPDRLPEALRDLIRQFPAGALQFELGIQTFNEAVAALINRRQNYARLEDNLAFLRRETGVHVHADLIAGLPGESIESFAEGFDKLASLGPQEIQVGILKRLRGAPISRHTGKWGMIYSPLPPYEVLSNNLINFSSMQELRRFARFWDLVSNSGNFRETAPLLWSAASHSPFTEFMAFSQWLFARMRRTDSIALGTLAEALFDYLTTVQSHRVQTVAEMLWRDYQRGGRTDMPGFLASLVTERLPIRSKKVEHLLPKRQARHIS